MIGFPNASQKEASFYKPIKYHLPLFEKLSRFHDTMQSVEHE